MQQHHWADFMVASLLSGLGHDLRGFKDQILASETLPTAIIAYSLIHLPANHLACPTLLTLFWSLLLWSLVVVVAVIYMVMATVAAAVVVSVVAVLVVLVIENVIIVVLLIIQSPVVGRNMVKPDNVHPVSDSTPLPHSQPSLDPSYGNSYF